MSEFKEQGREQAVEAKIEEWKKSPVYLVSSSKYRAVIKKDLRKIYSAELVDFLFANPFYTIKRLMSEQGVHRNTASKYLNLLLEKGMVKMIKIKKENVYFNEDFLGLLK